MNTPLPDNLPRSVIETAIHKFDEGWKHHFGKSTKYDLFFEGKRYPPKAIVGIAAELATNKTFYPVDFSGGLGSKCFRLLESVGFEVFPKEGFIEDEETEEKASTRVFYEGDSKVRTARQYERSSSARKECLRIRGTRCFICDFCFEGCFGSIGAGFIHVHHIEQISDSDGVYSVDPSKDLVPVCPNCHAMLHRRRPPFHPDELKVMRKANLMLTTSE